MCEVEPPNQEDMQYQKRGQRMRMIHKVMMNIIYSDTDDSKVSECAGFQSCLPCLSLYIHLYDPINPSIFAGSYCRALSLNK